MDDPFGLRMPWCQADEQQFMSASRIQPMSQPDTYRLDGLENRLNIVENNCRELKLQLEQHSTRIWRNEYLIDSEQIKIMKKVSPLYRDQNSAVMNGIDWKQMMHLIVALDAAKTKFCIEIENCSKKSLSLAVTINNVFYHKMQWIRCRDIIHKQDGGITVGMHYNQNQVKNKIVLEHFICKTMSNKKTWANIFNEFRYKRVKKEETLVSIYWASA